METLDNWITTAISWIDTIPVTGWAIIAGLLIGSMSTQWLKRTFPLAILAPNMSLAKRKMSLRILALVFSFCPTYFIWPDNNAIWAALAVGFSTPAVYKMVLFVVYKKWPDLRTRLTGTGDRS